MAELLEEYYIYKDILTLIEFIYCLLQAAHWCLKEYIKTMTLKAGFKKCKTDPCILYRVNELGAEIAIVYVDDTLANG